MQGHIMKKFTLFLTLLIYSSISQAVLLFDQDVTSNVIMGSGITNGSFTVDRSNGIELGLRGKLRHNAMGDPENTFNSNGDGTYSFDAGVAPGQVFPTAVWSFEWSINTDFDGSTGLMLDDLVYAFSIDSDPGLATDFTTFDPINLPFADHSIGDNSTAESAGDEATDAADYAALIAANNLAQNSSKAHWAIPGFDPTVDGVYDFTLEAFTRAGEMLAATNIQIIVGAGAAVPEPSTLALFFIALAGMSRLRFRS